MRRHSNAAVSGLSSINITDFSFGKIGKRGEIVLLAVNYVVASRDDLSDSLDCLQKHLWQHLCAFPFNPFHVFVYMLLIEKY